MLKQHYLQILNAVKHYLISSTNIVSDSEIYIHVLFYDLICIKSDEIESVDFDEIWFLIPL